MINNSNYSIQSIIGGYDDNFCYVITCHASGIQIIIDPSIELASIKSILKGAPAAILISHSHHDHIKYIDEYVENYPGIFIFGHPSSSDKFLYPNFKFINDNEIIKIGNLRIKSLHTPGHYFDSICYFLSPVIFTGDTLFVGRTGRVISSGSNIEDLYSSIYDKILKLPGHLRIYPGHHYGEKKSITLKNNIKISPLLQAVNFKDFSKRMVDYEKSKKSNVL